MVIPVAVCAYKRYVKFLVERRYRDIESVHFIHISIAVCNCVCCRLQKLCSILLGILCKTGKQVHYFFRLEADMDCHLPVLYGQYSSVLIGLAYVEH